MAEKEFDPEDPFTLTGMVLPMRRDQAEAAETAMAECFIEEYMRLGRGDAEILELFENPFYRATNAVYRARGAKFVSELISGVRHGERGPAFPEPHRAPAQRGFRPAREH